MVEHCSKAKIDIKQAEGDKQVRIVNATCIECPLKIEDKRIHPGRLCDAQSKADGYIRSQERIQCIHWKIVQKPDGTIQRVPVYRAI